MAIAPAADPSLPPADEEARRQRALDALDLVDSAPEREFDAAVALAARLLGTQIAAISLVDNDRTWFKAAEGVEVAEDVRRLSFCTWAIRDEATMIVEDAADDRRFDTRAAAYGGHHTVRGYAGTPLHAPTGERIGTLCVGSIEPRSFDQRDIDSLQEVAILVDALIAARSTAREAIDIATESDKQATRLQRQERVLLQAQRLAMIGSWRLQLIDSRVEWSDNVFRIHGLEIGDMPGLDAALDFYPPHARATVSEALACTIETGATFDIEVDFITAQGIPRRVREVGELEIEGGRPVAVIGVFQDVTERHALEQTLRHSANTDDLTRLANRAAYNRALTAAMARARTESTPLLLALIDLDRFKAINDSHGHLAGDDVLRAVGRRLQQPWLAGSFAARIGGDEFALIVEDPGLCADPDGLIRNLTRDLAMPLRGDAGTLSCAGTVGIALLGPETSTQRDLHHEADTMLYVAKRALAGERRRAG